MSSSTETVVDVIDLTSDPAKIAPLSSSSATPSALHNIDSEKKRKVEATLLPATKGAKVSKKSEVPHVLIWICHHGRGQSKTWSKKSLHIVGVYKNKEEAEEKKKSVMSQHRQCGYGDIMVGGTCWDEIDLVVRPAEECTL